MPRKISLVRPKSTNQIDALANGIQSIQYERLGDKIRFEQLLNLEHTKTELFEKARDFDQFKIAHSFVGTILPYLITSPLSWAMASMYVLLRCFLRYEVIHLGDDLPEMNGVVTSIVGGFMSFFLVFFVSQAYARFVAQYNHSKNIIKCITRTVLVARNTLPQAEVLRIIRYLNSAHIAGYVALSKTYTAENLFHPMVERYQLLNEREIARLKVIGLESGSSVLRELMTWILDIIYRVYDDQYQTFNDGSKGFAEWKFLSHPRRMENVTLQMLTNGVVEFNANFTDLFTFREQTFPFSYMHLLVLINACYLLLITYTISIYIPVGKTLFPDLLGAFVIFCNLIFTTGMREIGGHMIDPYGSDVTDLPIVNYIQTAVISSLEIVQGERLPSAELDDELQIHAKRPKLRPVIPEPSYQSQIPNKEVLSREKQETTLFDKNRKEAKKDEDEDEDDISDLGSGRVRDF